MNALATQQKWFITFGGPTANYHNAVKRICKQANNIDVFDNIIGYTDNDLKTDTAFWKRHKDFIETNTRGYGYWLWKSYLTKKTLEKMNDDDILVYADAGCIINPHGKPRLLEYFDIVNQSPHGNFSIQMPEHLEKCWTKMAVFDFCDVNNQANITETGQLIGTIYVLRKCTYTIELIDQWYHCCCQYHILDDSNGGGTVKNHETFLDNRHDQSLFSVLRKKHGTEKSTFDETWFAPDWNTRGHHYPFWAMRMRY